jgi:hypothetical protein
MIILLLREFWTLAPVVSSAGDALSRLALRGRRSSDDRFVIADHRSDNAVATNRALKCHCHLI